MPSQPAAARQRPPRPGSAPGTPDQVPFARAPFFHLVFAHAARAAEGPVLVDLLNGALRRRPAYPTYILEAAARRFAALGDRPRTIRALRAAAVVEPRQSASIANLTALAGRAGKGVSPLWSKAIRILTFGAPIHLSDVLLDVAENTFETADYLTVLDTLADVAKPDTYLEIGIGTGASQECFRGARRTIAVDPAPKADLTRFPDLEFHRDTSDDYFAALSDQENRPAADVIFIDGLHESDQVLRDFANAERVAGDRALVMLHDVMPLDPLSESKQRRLQFWPGDCWRALHFLARRWPDLDIAVVSAAPSGLGIIRLPDRRPGTAEVPSLDDFQDYAERLDLNRDLGPMLLGLKWLAGDSASLSDFAAGGNNACRGYAHYAFEADDALLLSACGSRSPELNALTHLRMRLVWDPASPVDAGRSRLFGLKSLTTATGSLLYRILMRALCVQPGDTALSSTAGLILDTLHASGKMDVLAGLRWGGLLANRMDRNILFDAKIRVALAEVAPAQGPRSGDRPLGDAVQSAMSDLGDRIGAIARESGTTPEIARNLARIAATALLAGRTPPPGAMQPAGIFEVWKAHPASTGTVGPDHYNRIGYHAGRPVPDARVTARRLTDRTTLSSSLNVARVASVPGGFITDGMLVGSPRDGLLLGDFLGFPRHRRLVADSTLTRDAEGLVSLSPAQAVIRASARDVAVEGPAVPGLNSLSSTVFGHFVLETLGRSLAARNAGGTETPTIVLPQGVPSFVESIYRLFGFSSFLRLEPGDRAVADSVHLATTSEEVLANFALYDLVRSEAVHLTGRSGPARIYLSRRGLKGADRYQTNEAEVEARLTECGFAVIHPEFLSFEDQIALYRGAEIVASPYGSAIHVAALFARPGTRFVEAMTRRPARDMVTYYQSFGHRYTAVPSAFVDPSGQGFEIDKEALISALR